MFFRSKKDKADEPAKPEKVTLLPGAEAAPPASSVASGSAAAPAASPAPFMGGLGAAAAPAAAMPAGAPGTAGPSGAAGVVEGQKDALSAFAQIVTMLMRAPEARGLTLADLEWLVVPALKHSQAVIAEVRNPNGAGKMPMGLLLWASVSAEVDQRLQHDPAVLPRLAPEEWTSGPNKWVVAGLGNKEVVQAMLGQLARGALSGQRIKVRAKGPDGRIQIREFARS